MKTSENINEISKAMSLAQGEMKPASKSTVNPFYKSTYSTLSQVMDAIREPFAKNNLCIFQDVRSTETGIAVSTRVCHSSGQWIEFGPMEIPLNKKDAQAVGSATSYGKRYSLSAAVGVVSDYEDDDGNQACNIKSPSHESKKVAVESKNETVKFTPKERDELIIELGDVLEDCGKDYEDKICQHYKIKNIEGIPDADLKKVINKALAFREVKRKQDESNAG